VIWSLKSTDFSGDQAKLIKESKVDGIRISYSLTQKKEALSFLSDLKSAYGDVSNMPFVMLDVTPPARGKVVGLEEELILEAGQKVGIAKSGSSKTADVFVDSESWDQLFEEKATIFLGYGDAVLKIKKVSSELVEAEVVSGGVLKPNMELHVPETKKVSDIKVDDLDFEKFLELGVNGIVLPGNSSSEQLKEVRSKYPSNSAESPLVIYRIDSESAISKLDSLIENVDGVIISRRELALTSNPSLVPIQTKEMIQLCRNKAKIVMVASEMLGSMNYNATPTRAEVSDIANGVYDGADALMLSEDIASGKYASKAYGIAHDIICDLEDSGDKHDQNWVSGGVDINSEMDSICVNAMTTAKRVGAKAIVCITKSGNTAVRLSSLNHEKPIVAVTFDDKVKRKLDILRGVEGMVLRVDPNIDEVLPEVNELLKERSNLNIGDRIVFVTVTLSSLGLEASNLFTIQTIS
jgi:pyruvate kinase